MIGEWLRDLLPVVEIQRLALLGLLLMCQTKMLLKFGPAILAIQIDHC